MNDWLQGIRFRLHSRVIRFYWACESWLENCPHPRQHGHIFFDPIFTPTVLISLAISAGSFGAQMILTRLLAPKQKPAVKKGLGEITLTDSIHGAPIPRIYGGPNDVDQTAGGVEAGTNFIWMSEIRRAEIQTPGGGGGGKGAPDPPPNIQVTYKVDIAGILGDGRGGRLHVLRMKFNEDTAFSEIGGGPPGIGFHFEAEAPANTLSGGAVIEEDLECSGDFKVTGIGAGGMLRFLVTNFPLLEDPGPPGGAPRYVYNITYKAVGDKWAFVRRNGTGGVYLFEDTGGDLGVKSIDLLPVVTTLEEYFFEITHPTLEGPEVDCLDIAIEYPETVPGPTGHLNEDFPPEDPQDNILLPDPYEPDTQAAERYNRPIPASVDSVVTFPIINGASISIYEGSSDQPIDPVIEAAVTALYGPGMTPAFRNTSYFRISNLDFTEYGTIPAIRSVVKNMDTQTVEEILLFEGTHGGAEHSLVEDDFDLAAAADKHCRGFYMADTESPAKAFEEMGLVHNLNFAESHDGKITSIDLSDRTIVAQITADDLGAYVAKETDEVPLDDVTSSIPEESQDLVRVLELQFNNPLPPADFNSDRRAYNFPFTSSQKKEAKSYSGTLLPVEAAVIIKRELQKHHLQQSPDAIITTHKFAWLNVGQCIEVEIEDEMHPRRIEEKTGSSPGVYEMSLINEDIYVLADDGTITEEYETVSENVGPMRSKSITRFPANSIGTIMDIPALLDQHEGIAGVYVAACSRGSGKWDGCQVMRLKGGEYTSMAALTKQAMMGRTVGAVGGIPVGEGPDVPSPTGLVVVDFFNDFNPSTVTGEAAGDGANAFLVGSEVMIIQTWTRDNDYPNRWTGEGLYRGQCQTEHAGESHASSERVVLLDDAVKFVPLDRNEVDVTRTWKFVTYGGQIEDTSEVEFIWEGEHLAPARSLFQHFTPATTTTITDEILYIDQIDARTLYSNGDTIEAVYAGIFTETDPKILRLQLAATQIFGSEEIFEEDVAWRLTVTLIRKNDTTVLYSCALFFGLIATLPANVTSGEVTGLGLRENNYPLSLIGYTSDVAGVIRADLGYGNFLPSAATNTGFYTEDGEVLTEDGEPFWD